MAAALLEEVVGVGHRPLRYGKFCARRSTGVGQVPRRPDLDRRDWLSRVDRLLKRGRELVRRLARQRSTSGATAAPTAQSGAPANALSGRRIALDEPRRRRSEPARLAAARGADGDGARGAGASNAAANRPTSPGAKTVSAPSTRYGGLGRARRRRRRAEPSRACLSHRRERDAEAAAVAGERSTCSARWPDDERDVADSPPPRARAGAAASTGCAVDRQHRLRVALGQRPQPAAETGRHHDRREGHAPAASGARRSRAARCGRSRPRRIAAQQRAQLAPGRPPRPRLASGGPKRASPSAAARTGGRRRRARSRTSSCSSRRRRAGARPRRPGRRGSRRARAGGRREPPRIRGSGSGAAAGRAWRAPIAVPGRRRATASTDPERAGPPSRTARRPPPAPGCSFSASRRSSSPAPPGRARPRRGRRRTPPAASPALNVGDEAL